MGILLFFRKKDFRPVRRSRQLCWLNLFHSRGVNGSFHWSSHASTHIFKPFCKFIDGSCDCFANPADSLDLAVLFLLFRRDRGDTGANVLSWFQFDLEALLDTGNQISLWQLQAGMVSGTHTHTHTLFGGLFLSLKEAEENNLLLFQLFSVISLTFAVMVQNISAVFGRVQLTGLFRTHEDLKQGQSKRNEPTLHWATAKNAVCVYVRACSKKIFLFLSSVLTFFPSPLQRRLFHCPPEQSTELLDHCDMKKIVFAQPK